MAQLEPSLVLWMDTSTVLFSSVSDVWVCVRDCGVGRHDLLLCLVIIINVLSILVVVLQ